VPEKRFFQGLLQLALSRTTAGQGKVEATECCPNRTMEAFRLTSPRRRKRRSMIACEV
jgi:hypothetical protein